MQGREDPQAWACGAAAGVSRAAGPTLTGAAWRTGYSLPCAGVGLPGAVAGREGLRDRRAGGCCAALGKEEEAEACLVGWTLTASVKKGEDLRAGLVGRLAGGR